MQTFEKLLDNNERQLEKSVTEVLKRKDLKWDFAFKDDGAYNFVYATSVKIGSNNYRVNVSYIWSPSTASTDEWERYDFIIGKKMRDGKSYEILVNTSNNLAYNIYNRLEKKMKMEKKTTKAKNLPIFFGWSSYPL